MEECNRSDQVRSGQVGRWREMARVRVRVRVRCRVRVRVRVRVRG